MYGSYFNIFLMKLFFVLEGLLVLNGYSYCILSKRVYLFKKNYDIYKEK